MSSVFLGPGIVIGVFGCAWSSEGRGRRVRDVIWALCRELRLPWWDAKPKVLRSIRTDVGWLWVTG
jgi:hypothetical protein